MSDSIAKKKVLFVITKSNFGGAQRYVHDLATHLPKDRFEPVVAFGYGGKGQAGQLSRLCISAGIRTIVIPELERDVNAGSDWHAFRTLVAMFKDEKPDIVHLNSSKAGGLGAVAARLTGVPRIIFTVHGLPSDENRPLLQKWAIRFATWLTIVLTHRTILMSNEGFERARRMPFLYKKAVLIYNGIETPQFETRVEARKALQSIDPLIPENDTLLGTIAELHPNKDLKLAIDAVARTKDVHFAIIGDGELRAELLAHAQKNGIEKRIHFLGFVVDAAKYIRAFDVFVLTSIKEGLPYVLMEAGAACVPIVAVDIPGVRDIVLNEFTGLTTPRDAAKIASTIERVVSDKALANSLTSEMSTRTQKTFSLRQMLEKTLALY